MHDDTRTSTIASGKTGWGMLEGRRRGVCCWPLSRQAASTSSPPAPASDATGTACRVYHGAAIYVHRYVSQITCLFVAGFWADGVKRGNLQSNSGKKAAAFCLLEGREITNDPQQNKGQGRSCCRRLTPTGRQETPPRQTNTLAHPPGPYPRLAVRARPNSWSRESSAVVGACTYAAEA